MAAKKDEFDDLYGIDLSRLDLSDVDLEIEQPSSAGRWLVALLLLGLGAGILWLPTTSYYQRVVQSSWPFFAICAVATVVGIIGGRLLWRWVEESAARAARSRRREAPAREPPRPPSAFVRWVTLLLVVSGMVLILVILPSSGLVPVGTEGTGTVWFFASLGSIVVGILAGRWVLMQGAITKPHRAPPRPLRLPPWFKWLTLAGLVVAAVVVLVGPSLAGGSSESFQFALGGVAFVVGIVGAMWLARRFDESEAKIRARTQQKGIQPPPPQRRRLPPSP